MNYAHGHVKLGGVGQVVAREIELDGLLPEKRYVGKSPQGDVVVSATAEPGPPAERTQYARPLAAWFP